MFILYSLFFILYSLFFMLIHVRLMDKAEQINVPEESLQIYSRAVDTFRQCGLEPKMKSEFEEWELVAEAGLEGEGEEEGTRKESEKGMDAEEDGYCEPIFKLTFFLLEGDEVPNVLYGDRPDDRYQNAEGIVRSTRTIPVSIQPKRMISSTAEKIDPQRQLREAGPPFNYISQELTVLHGKFEVVSNDVRLLKTAITDETTTLSEKVDSSQKTVLEKVEALFNQKFLQAAAAIVACLSIMYGIITFLKDKGITGVALGWVALISGFGVLLVIYLVSRQSPHSK